MLELFRYAHPSKSVHRLMVFISSFVSLAWLYFAVIHKQLMQRMVDGNMELLDALLGFPLILALTLVIYASCFWLMKWLLIFFVPHWLHLPPEDHGEDFDPSASQSNSDTNKNP